MTTVAGVVAMAQTTRSDVHDDVNAYLHGEPSTTVTTDNGTVSVTPDPRQGVQHRLVNLFNPAVTGVAPDLNRAAEGWNNVRNEGARKPARRAVTARKTPSRNRAGGGYGPGNANRRLQPNRGTDGEFSMYRRSRFYEKKRQDDRDRRRNIKDGRINNSRIRINRPASRIFGQENRLSVFERSSFYKRYGSRYDYNSTNRKRRNQTSGRFRGR